MIENFNTDISCLCETWLAKADKINVNGYKWIGQNRSKLAKNAVRGSGGVGLLVKERLYDKFNINVWDSSYEGILWVRFKQQQNSQVVFLICVCYLPPSSSSRGDTSQEFFETLGNQYLFYSNCGLVCICGDFNARCGSCQDIPDSDNFIPQR